MAKYYVEVCVASARGLPRTFFRSQWFAVAWINPKLKYCTGVDTRGTATPVWNTKFSATLDDADAILHVQVFSRDSLFLKERLEGSVRIHLREFLAKLEDRQSPSGGFPASGQGLIVESASFQLRKKHSQKPRGFVDVSVRISDRPDVESWASREGMDGTFNDMPVSISGGNEILSTDDGVNQSYSYSLPPPSSQGKTGRNSLSHFPPNNAPEFAPNEASLHVPPENARPPTPPPPPPPSNTGFLLPFFGPSSSPPNATYSGMPLPRNSSAGRGRRGPGFGVGAAGGAMAAGVFLFGDDFLNIMDTSSFDGGSVAITGNPHL